MSPERPAVRVPAPHELDLPTDGVVRGLDAVDSARPAFEVLAAIAWEGAALDPDATPAGEFLALL